MASSSYTEYAPLDLGEEYTYPYPTNLSAASFISVKLSGKEDYDMWKAQMVCLLESHGMFGFIDGTLISPKTSSSGYGKEKVGDHQTPHRLWKRSDALVKGWILGSFSKQTLRHVLDRLTEKLHQERNNGGDFSAKDVWDELHTMYAPTVLPQQKIVDGPVAVLPHGLVEDKEQEDKRAKTLQSFYEERRTYYEDKRAKSRQYLYDLTLTEYWTGVAKLLDEGTVTLRDKIMNNGNTALHVAVGTSRDPHFLMKMLEQIPENTQLLDLINSDGSTLLHIAAIVGNTRVVEMLVDRHPELLLAQDNEGHTPLNLALSNMHTGTAKHLLHNIDTYGVSASMFSGRSGDELLVTVISSKDFHLAYSLMIRYGKFHSDAVLMALAQNFPCQPRLMKKYIVIYKFKWKFETCLETAFGYMGPLRFFWVEVPMRMLIVGIFAILMLFPLILSILVWLFVFKRIDMYMKAVRLLREVSYIINRDPNTQHHYYTNPIFEATRQNKYEIVIEIVSRFPNAIHSTNEDDHNIIQYAVISRSEKVYNLLYQMSEHKNVYRTMKDSYGNNLLHLAGRLAPTNKLNLVSGAALQIQHELQWFKEVQRFVCPLNIMQKNSFGETPQMVFTREHKDLVIEGEKWMKSTAESYTISAALITTIVFAAAITVPGGSNQDTGTPLFTNDNAFTIFAISDAISLFAAVTSLLMFLSILTARFAEQDFLFTLPTKLIIGLTTLFISTTTMIIAFGATLYLVFGQSNSKILIPIVVMTCLPIASFMTLQFPLILDLMSATYGRSIFGKKNTIYNYESISPETLKQRFY